MNFFKIFKSLCLPALMIAMAISGCVTETTKDGKPYDSEKNKKVNLEQALSSYVSLATEYMRQGDRVNALRAINKGLAINPKSPEMLNVLAFYYESDGESELAEKEFKKAISSDKSHTASYLNYGRFLYEHGRFEESCAVLKKATDDVMYAKRDDAFVNYGICLKKLGKESESVEAYNRALQHNYRNGKALLELASIEFDKGEFSKSQNYYDDFLKVSKQNPRSLWLGIRLAHISNDHDKKASYVLYLKNQFPESREYAEYLNWDEGHQ